MPNRALVTVGEMVSDTLHQHGTSSTAHRRPLLTVFLGWLWLMAGANLAAPLYAVYAGRYGFSGIVLTTVFATYAVTLVATLLVCGRLADRFGRRPVILVGLVVAALALVVFAGAQATWWLYAARALQGIAVGLISGPATAALVEIDPQRDQARPALLAGLAQAVGSGVGPLLGGTLAQWAPGPLHTSYLLGLAGTAVAGGFAWALPERHRGEEPWRMQWPRVPREIRRDFARLGLTAGLVWASLALYLSVVPSYVAGLLSTDNLALLGANSALACFASAGTQIWTQRRRSSDPGDRRRWQAIGLGLLAAGLVLMVVSSLTQSLVTVLLGAVVTGVGHGLGYLHAQDELNEIAPSRRRAEVSAAFVCCIYLLVGGSVVGVGVLEEIASLTAAVAIVGGLLTLGAVAGATWQARAA
jgi:MFS family permease